MPTEQKLADTQRSALDVAACNASLQQRAGHGWKSTPQATVETPKPAALLETSSFAHVVANAPLVAFDLIVEDERGTVLLGLRSNPPAKGFWFVPGGRIRKNESLDAAFSRISVDELGVHLARTQCQFMNVYEHNYETNFAGTPGATTHYVVLAYRAVVERKSLRPPIHQHSHYRWMTVDELLADLQVHPYTKAYFAA